MAAVEDDAVAVAGGGVRNEAGSAYSDVPMTSESGGAHTASSAPSWAPPSEDGDDAPDGGDADGEGGGDGGGLPVLVDGGGDEDDGEPRDDEGGRPRAGSGSEEPRNSDSSLGRTSASTTIFGSGIRSGTILALRGGPDPAPQLIAEPQLILEGRAYTIRADGRIQSNRERQHTAGASHDFRKHQGVHRVSFWMLFASRDAAMTAKSLAVCLLMKEARSPARPEPVYVPLSNAQRQHLRFQVVFMNSEDVSDGGDTKPDPVPAVILGAPQPSRVRMNIAILPELYTESGQSFADLCIPYFDDDGTQKLFKFCVSSNDQTFTPIKARICAAQKPFRDELELPKEASFGVVTDKHGVTHLSSWTDQRDIVFVLDATFHSAAAEEVILRRLDSLSSLPIPIQFVVDPLGAGSRDRSHPLTGWIELPLPARAAVKAKLLEVIGSIEVAVSGSPSEPKVVKERRLLLELRITTTFATACADVVQAERERRPGLEALKDLTLGDYLFRIPVCSVAGTLAGSPTGHILFRMAHKTRAVMFYTRGTIRDEHLDNACTAAQSKVVGDDRHRFQRLVPDDVDTSESFLVRLVGKGTTTWTTIGLRDDTDDDAGLKSMTTRECTVLIQAFHAQFREKFGCAAFMPCPAEGFKMLRGNDLQPVKKYRTSSVFDATRSSMHRPDSRRGGGAGAGAGGVHADYSTDGTDGTDGANGTGDSTPTAAGGAGGPDKFQDTHDKLGFSRSNVASRWPACRVQTSGLAASADGVAGTPSSLRRRRELSESSAGSSDSDAAAAPKAPRHGSVTHEDARSSDEGTDGDADGGAGGGTGGGAGGGTGGGTGGGVGGEDGGAGAGGWVMLPPQGKVRRRRSKKKRLPQEGPPAQRTLGVWLNPALPGPVPDDSA
mmetsp:Transcript_15828/g.55045  ORF Transcript_15828/g.55045 Transcript_15828/m.55045 type:complete len:891 (-) Transcript_15828:1210-3882(-)